MAAVIGKDGDIRIGSVTLSLDSWTLNPTFNTADITKFGNKTKVNTQTLMEWSAEGSGTLDMADAQQGALLDQFKLGAGGSVVNLRLYTRTATSAVYWTGSAILTGANVQSTVGDKVTVSYSFACAGNITESP
jgi:hypothetical protein